MTFQSLLKIGALLATENRDNLQDLECEINSAGYDIDITIALIGRLLAASDPAKITDCLGDVGGLLEGLANLRLQVTGDLGEFQMMSSETVTP